MIAACSRGRGLALVALLVPLAQALPAETPPERVLAIGRLEEEGLRAYPETSWSELRSRQELALQIWDSAEQRGERLELVFAEDVLEPSTERRLSQPSLDESSLQWLTEEMHRYGIGSFLALSYRFALDVIRVEPMLVILGEEARVRKLGAVSFPPAELNRGMRRIADSVLDELSGRPEARPQQRRLVYTCIAVGSSLRKELDGDLRYRLGFVLPDLVAEEIERYLGSRSQYRLERTSDFKESCSGFYGAKGQGNEISGDDLLLTGWVRPSGRGSLTLDLLVRDSGGRTLSSFRFSAPDSEVLFTQVRKQAGYRLASSLTRYRGSQ